MAAILIFKIRSSLLRSLGPKTHRVWIGHKFTGPGSGTKKTPWLQTLYIRCMVIRKQESFRKQGLFVISIVRLLAFLTDSPIFRDRQTWTSEGTAGNVHGLSVRWSSQVPGGMFFISHSCFPLKS